MFTLHWLLHSMLFSTECMHIVNGFCLSKRLQDILNFFEQNLNLVTTICKINIHIIYVKGSFNLPWKLWCLNITKLYGKLKPLQTFIGTDSEDKDGQHYFRKFNRNVILFWIHYRLKGAFLSREFLTKDIPFRFPKNNLLIIRDKSFKKHSSDFRNETLIHTVMILILWLTKHRFKSPHFIYLKQKLLRQDIPPMVVQHEKIDFWRFV